MSLLLFCIQAISFYFMSFTLCVLFYYSRHIWSALMWIMSRYFVCLCNFTLFAFAVVFFFFSCHIVWCSVAAMIEKEKNLQEYPSLSALSCLIQCLKSARYAWNGLKYYYGWMIEDRNLIPTLASLQTFREGISCRPFIAVRLNQIK